MGRFVSGTAGAAALVLVASLAPFLCLASGDTSGSEGKKERADYTGSDAASLDAFSNVGTTTDTQAQGKQEKKEDQSSDPPAAQANSASTNPNKTFTPDDRILDTLSNPTPLANTPTPLSNGDPYVDSLGNGGWGNVAPTTNMLDPNAVDLRDVGAFDNTNYNFNNFNAPSGYQPSLCLSMGYGTGCSPG